MRIRLPPMGTLITALGLAFLPSCSTEKRSEPPSAAIAPVVPCDKHKELFASYHTLNKGELEETIAKQWKVDVHGVHDETSLETIASALSKCPAIDPCSIYLLPPEEFPKMKGLFDEYRILGAYFPPTHTLGEKILLFTPLTASTVTHEFAHKRTNVLGEEFLAKWRAVNKNKYGTECERDASSVYSWKDKTKGVRYGFAQPYGNKNELEDIATLTEYVRHETKAIAPDKTCARIIAKKLELLSEYKFISADEAEETRKTLGYTRRKRKN